MTHRFGMDLLRDPARRGLMNQIARELGISRSAVVMWRDIPAERVPDVARISGYTRHQLRPDLWEAPNTPEPAEAAD